MYRRTKFTYAQLDKVLRSLGFSRRDFEKDGRGVCYDHKETGAWIILPEMSKDEHVVDYHLDDVRTTLDGFGIADPTALVSKLQKAG